MKHHGPFLSKFCSQQGGTEIKKCHREKEPEDIQRSLHLHVTLLKGQQNIISLEFFNKTPHAFPSFYLALQVLCDVHIVNVYEI